MKNIKFIILSLIFSINFAFAYPNLCSAGFSPKFVSKSAPKTTVFTNQEYYHADYGHYFLTANPSSFLKNISLSFAGNTIDYGFNRVTPKSFNTDGTVATYSVNHGISAKTSLDYSKYWDITYVVETYSCELSCSDGGASLNNSCNRTCEDVGLISHKTFSMSVGGSGSGFGEKTICINNDAEFSDEGQNYSDLNQNTNISSQTSYNEALQKCTNTCGSGNVANMSNSGDCSCISATIDYNNPTSNPEQNTDTTKVTENSANVTQNTSNNSQTSQTVQDKVINYSFDDSELTDADLQKIIDDVQVGNQISNNIDNNIQDLNDNVVKGLNQVNQNLGAINGTLKDSSNFEKDKLQKDFEQSQNELDEIEEQKQEDEQKRNEEDTDFLNFFNRLLDDYNNSKSKLDQIESSVGAGFTASLGGGGGSSGCMEISAFGGTYTINPCNYISQMSGVISTLTQLLLILMAVKIAYLGLSNLRVIK